MGRLLDNENGQVLTAVAGGDSKQTNGRKLKLLRVGIALNVTA